MPQFFFDFRQAGILTPDTEGVEFDTVEQAYLEAFRTAQDMWSELLRRRRDPRRCCFEVHSEAREMLFIFPFQEVIDSCTDRIVPPIPPSLQQLVETFNSARLVREELAQLVQHSQQVLLESRKHLRQVPDCPPPAPISFPD